MKSCDVEGSISCQDSKCTSNLTSFEEWEVEEENNFAVETYDDFLSNIWDNYTMDGSIVDFKTLGASVMHPGDQTDLQNFHLKTQKALWTDKKPLDSPKANEKLYNKQISELIATKMNFNFEQFGVNFAPLDDLIKILHQREEKNIISIDFMDNHTSIDHSMREILLDWLMEVCQLYSLHQETFYLAISLIDRFMNQSPFLIHRDQYQLLGITALFTASKLEEIYPPKIDNYSYITDNKYSNSDIQKQERALVQMLEFNLHTISPLLWLRIMAHRVACIPQYSKMPNLSSDIYAAASNILSLLVLDVHSVGFLPSVLACTAIAFVLKFNFLIVSDKKEGFIIAPLPETLKHYSNNSKIYNNFLNSRVNALDDQCLWNFIMFSDQYSDQLIECINYSFPFTLSVAERDKNDASATFYINFQMVGEERNISNEIKTPLTNQIGPYDPQLLQKHSNEIELLKRVRVWQQRLRHCDSLAFLQQYFAEVSW